GKALQPGSRRGQDASGKPGQAERRGEPAPVDLARALGKAGVDFGPAVTGGHLEAELRGKPDVVTGHHVQSEIASGVRQVSVDRSVGNIFVGARVRIVQTDSRAQPHSRASRTARRVRCGQAVDVGGDTEVDVPGTTLGEIRVTGKTLVVERQAELR